MSMSSLTSGPRKEQTSAAVCTQRKYGEDTTTCSVQPTASVAERNFLPSSLAARRPASLSGGSNGQERQSSVRHQGLPFNSEPTSSARSMCLVTAKNSA
eukprot:CAMPEP_0197640790 /NCGR_PEP_ID=MMETSP1338-20131121/14958_1 /TAXON_ID=43686 ORGANISM="Pelagodinium beii, Strain RCC1491" /NCGR_SAMPLE_ID=MMETSP1338 /ASSEMBLY_ACC=CAM_ASM_000754 /LENGTH=98 /DNA_ID=CAMNT_0043213665 /DNA_START=214 /DNA_END=510 /DNA_ORIENTATION=+